MTTDGEIHAYTSINLNYLPRARVLGASMKKHHPEVVFHLMLSDKLPEWFKLEDEPFDSVILINDLGVEDTDAWVFKHEVVEMCTAVKPFACLHIMKMDNVAKVFYFDPDVVIFSRFDAMISDLDTHSAILTPHVCSPEKLDSAIRDNEMSCLRHGINNLGYLGVANHGQGVELIEWWAKRLLNYCYDDIPMGLFTDQRWMDFAHVFFDKVKIDKGSQYNVATWNYTTRVISGDMENGVFVDGEALCFHHFSGFTNGAAEMMQGKYASGMKVIEELYAWYKDECEKAGQSKLSLLKWEYGHYENGEPVEKAHRLLYRNKPSLQEAFPEPLKVEPAVNKSYCTWLKNNRDKLYMSHPSVGFTQFIVETEYRLYGYIERSNKAGRVLKKVSRISVRIFFYIIKKLISLFK